MTHRPARPPSAPAAALAAAVLVAAACGGGSSGSGSGSTHDRFFVVTGSHQGFSCEKCHDPAAASFTLAATPDGGTPGVECRQCHVKQPCDTAHGAMAGYAFDCARCISCHKDGTGGLPANHPFPVASGTAHASIPCSQCHGATKAKADLLCNTCHGGVTALNTAHAGLGGYSSASPACYDCHPKGTVDVNHAALTRFPVTHGGARNCADCHGATKQAADLKCYGCHDAPSDHSRRSGFRRGDSAQCYSCHSTGQGGD